MEKSAMGSEIQEKVLSPKFGNLALKFFRRGNILSATASDATLVDRQFLVAALNRTREVFDTGIEVLFVCLGDNELLPSRRKFLHLKVPSFSSRKMLRI